MESVNRTTRPFKIGSIVPWSKCRHVVDDRQQQEHGWVYRLRAIEPAPWRVLPAIAHQEIIDAITAFARFKVGDEVPIDQRVITFPIIERKWSFTLGTVCYALRDRVRPGMKVWKQQEVILHAANWHQRKWDTPPGAQPEAYPDLDLAG